MTIFGLGTPEIILIVVVLLLFFGKDKLPELARGIGKSVQELKAGLMGTGTPEPDAKKDASSKKGDGGKA